MRLKRYTEKHFLGLFPEVSSSWKKSIFSQCRIRDLQSGKYSYHSYPNGMLRQASWRRRIRQVGAAGASSVQWCSRAHWRSSPTLQVLTHTGGPCWNWRSFPTPSWPWSRRSIWAPQPGGKDSGQGGKVPCESSSSKVKGNTQAKKRYIFFKNHSSVIWFDSFDVICKM